MVNLDWTYAGVLLWSFLGLIIFAIIAPSDWYAHYTRRLQTAAVVCGPCVILVTTLIWVYESGKLDNIRDWLKEESQKKQMEKKDANHNPTT